MATRLRHGERDQRTIILMGAAAHKMNEAAAELLVRSSLVREQFSVAGVSLSQATNRSAKRRAADGLIQRTQQRMSSQLAEILRRGSVYLALGTSEGFGFPYVEATYFGCDVVAPRQSVVIEALGEAPAYLPNARRSVATLEAALELWILIAAGFLQGRTLKRTWMQTARQVAHVLGELT